MALGRSERTVPEQASILRPPNFENRLEPYMTSPESPTAVNHRYLAPRAGCSPTRGGAGAGYCNVVLISINSGGGSRANDTYCSKNTPNCPSCSKLQYPRNLVLQIARRLIAVQHHLRKLARSLERGYAL